MKNVITYLLLVVLLPSFLYAETSVSNVKIRYKKNGVIQTVTKLPGTSATIYPDFNSNVDVTVTRTSTSGVSGEFFLVDFNNGASLSFDLPDMSYTFYDCVGPLDAQIWTGVNSNEGRVEILVFWSTPPLPDLSVSNLRVNHTVYSNGLTFHVGETIDIDCGVYNFGTQSAPSSKLGYYVKSSSGNTSGSPTILQSVSTLTGGSNYFKQTTYTFANNDVGTRYIVVNADDYEGITEASENNNTRSFGPFQVLPAPSISLTPSSFVFETTEVGSCSDASSFVLTNTSTQNISGYVSVRNSTDFDIMEGGGQYNLSPGEELNINIQFCPLSEGAKSTVIQVSMDGYSTTVIQSSIAGTSVPEPEIITGVTDPFFLDTRLPFNGGIYLEIIETGYANIVKEVGYEYVYKVPYEDLDLFRRDTSYFTVSSNKTVMLLPEYSIPDAATVVDDFNDRILLFDENRNLIGHIGFSYTFKNESIHTRHAIIFFHNDVAMCTSDGEIPFFPYNKNSPNNASNWLGIKHRYDYYKDGEFFVSMLVPPHVNETSINPEGYPIPSEFNKIPVLFVHGLNGTFSYPNSATIQFTEELGDMVSYWSDVERKLNEKGTNGNLKFHGWQFYYANNDDIYHCGLALSEALEFLYIKYQRPINVVSHSMGGVVTLDLLTRGYYNKEKIGKVLLSMSPLHGSRKATVCRELKIDIADFDGWAPAYRDLSASSDFYYDLYGQSRVWDQDLIDSTVSIIGLTKKGYPGGEYIIEEADFHNDAAVCFSSASLINKGIGLIGLYGNHNDGRYSLPADQTVLTDIIETWIEDHTTNHESFNNFCNNRSSVELLINGQKDVLKPLNSTIDLLELPNRPDVDFQKGMLSLKINGLDRNHFRLLYNDYIKEYRLDTYNGILPSNYYNPVGYFKINIDDKANNHLYFESMAEDFGFIYSNESDCTPIHLLNSDGIPVKLGHLCRKNMEHQFLNYEINQSRNLLTDQFTRTKDLVMIGQEKQAEIVVDNQTSTAKFVFYSEQAYNENDYYSFRLSDPLNNIIDSTSNIITYSNDSITSVKRITINNPLPGKWKITPIDENSGNNYITKGEFNSFIKLSIYDSLKLYLDQEIQISCLLDVPNFNLLNNDSLTGYVNIHDGNGNNEIIQLPDRTLIDVGMIISGLFIPDSAGIYFLTYVVEGNYEGYRFERALYNDFEIMSSVASLSIPDQELNVVQNFSDVKLSQYFNCNNCDIDSVYYEIGLEENGNFLEENFHYNYSQASNTITIAVDQDSLYFSADFWVHCYISESIVAKDTFNVSYIPTGMPSGLYAYNIKEDSASLCWQPALFESEWQLAYGLKGFDILSSDTLITVNTIPDYTLSGLLPATNYDFYVRMVTESDTGYWAGPCSFVTLTTVDIRNISKDDDHSVLIYPNPTGGDFTARFIMPEDGQLQLSLYDLTGRLLQCVHSYRYMAGEFEIDWKNQNKLHPGIYILRSIAIPINDRGRFISDEFKIIVK